MRAVESASRASGVPPSLQGALRALALIRRRSGNDPRDGQLTDDERELRSLLLFRLPRRLDGVLEGVRDPEADADERALNRTRSSP
jgi:hypothetical protein